MQLFSTSVFLFYFIFVVADRLISETVCKYAAYNYRNVTFGFLSNISDNTVPEVRNKASDLQMKYAADFRRDFVVEILQFKDVFLKLVRKNYLQEIFPNVDFTRLSLSQMQVVSNLSLSLK